MHFSRRQFIGTTLGAGAALALSNCKTFSASAQLTTQEELTAYLRIFHEKIGLQEVEPLSLITGRSFNAGIRYDDEAQHMPLNTFRIQYAARIEDFDLANRLAHPSFTIAGVKTSHQEQGEALGAVLNLFTQHLGLEPVRLRVTTCAEFIAPYRATLSAYGISSAQIRFRPLDEAKQSASGSGHFSSTKDPEDGYPSLSIEYNDGNDEYELAECLLEQDTSARQGWEAYGIGVERLGHALGIPQEARADNFKRLLASIQAEAHENQVELPAAHNAAEQALAKL